MPIMPNVVDALWKVTFFDEGETVSVDAGAISRKQACTRISTDSAGVAALNGWTGSTGFPPIMVFPHVLNPFTALQARSARTHPRI